MFASPLKDPFGYVEAAVSFRLPSVGAWTAIYGSRVLFGRGGSLRRLQGWREPHLLDQVPGARVFADGLAAELIAQARQATDAVLEPLLKESEAKRVRLAETPEEAAALWANLADCTAAQRRMLVEELEEYRGWTLCEHVCTESLTAAAQTPEEARELASLALLIAEMTAGADRETLTALQLFRDALERQTVPAELWRPAIAAIEKARSRSSPGRNPDPLVRFLNA